MSELAKKCAAELDKNWEFNTPIGRSGQLIIERYLQQARDEENERCVNLLRENVSSLGGSQWNVCVRDMIQLIRAAKGKS